LEQGLPIAVNNQGYWYNENFLKSFFRTITRTHESL